MPGVTERVLDVLRDLDAVATFFCVGENVQANPQLAERALGDGHTLGNHSMHHDRGDGLAVRGLAHVIGGEAALAGVLGGRRPVLYRPPWGWLAPWTARRVAASGATVIGWDVEASDWDSVSCSESIARAVSASLRPGSIVNLHDGFAGAPEWGPTPTADALAAIVPAAREAGFEFVTVDALLDVTPYRPAG